MLDFLSTDLGLYVYVCWKHAKKFTWLKFNCHFIKQPVYGLGGAERLWMASYRFLLSWSPLPHASVPLPPVQAQIMARRARCVQAASRPSPTASYCVSMSGRGTRPVWSAPCAWVRLVGPAIVVTACCTASTTTKSKVLCVHFRTASVLLTPLPQRCLNVASVLP